MRHARDSFKILPGDPPVELILRRSTRARRITLRVSSLDGRVTLSLPEGVSERDALCFAEGKARWIRSHLAKRVALRDVGLNTALPVLGVQRRVEAGGPGQDGPMLRVDPARAIGPQVRAMVIHAARQALGDASARHAAALGLSIGRITLRDTRSRWGSCSARGNLNYSWRLALAPVAVLNYVAAHEVAHLRHMDHSAAFWAVVDDLCPDWRAHRQWLRENGAALHAWRFDG